MRALCIHNDPQLLKCPKKSTGVEEGLYPIVPSKIYGIAAILFWRRTTLFLVRDEDGHPRDAYAGFFEPFTGAVPEGWCFELGPGITVDITDPDASPLVGMLGPKELHDDYGFLDRLLSSYHPPTLAKFHEWIELAESSPPAASIAAQQSTATGEGLFDEALGTHMTQHEDNGNSQIGFRGEVQLSFQRALWDMVTPSLRGVVVRPDYPYIQARFLYERVSPEEHDLVSEVEVLVAADFLPPVEVEFVAALSPAWAPRDTIQEGEVWVYRRREGGS